MVKNIVLALIRFYQFTFSAVAGRSCRYYPSCSHYTAESVRRFGVMSGLYFGAKRILRCHPWHPGGYDPVPDIKTKE